MGKPHSYWSNISKNVIANPDGRDTRNVRRWYERQSEPKVIKRPPPKSETRQRVITKQLDDNPPTMYISPLSNDAWLEYYCDYTWDADYLTEIRDKIWDSLKLLVEIPRGHGKTWSVIGLFARYLLEIRKEILAIANTGTKDSIYMTLIDILTGEKVREDYGDVISTKNLTKGEIWFVKDLRRNADGSYMQRANFKVSGKWGESIGHHPGWIHLEDIIQLEAVSPLSNERLRMWFSRVIKFMKKRGTKITITATRKDIEDFYWYIETAHHFRVLLLTAMELVSGRYPKIDEVVADHDEEILTEYADVGEYKILGCPEWPLPALLYMYIYHYEDYMAEMENQPLSGRGKHFDADDWKEIEPLDETKNENIFNKYIVADPGFGSSDGASDTAIMVIGIRKGMFIIVDSEVGKFDLDEKAEKIIELHIKWDPLWTRAEDNFRQITTRYSPNSPLMRLRGFSVFEQFKDKNERIAAFKSPYRRGQIQIYNNCGHLNKIKAQYLTFRKDLKKGWDIYDALTSGYEMLSSFLGGSKVKLKMGSYRTRLS